jgi:hypothetical protein
MLTIGNKVIKIVFLLFEGIAFVSKIELIKMRFKNSRPYDKASFR